MQIPKLRLPPKQLSCSPYREAKVKNPHHRWLQQDSQSHRQSQILANRQCLFLLFLRLGGILWLPQYMDCVV